MARIMTRILILYSILYTCRTPCLPYSILTVLYTLYFILTVLHAPYSILYTYRTLYLPCSILHTPYSILILSVTNIMRYLTIILYHNIILVKSHTIRYPILMFIPYLFERYGIYPSRFYTILYYRRYSIEYLIRYIISFRYVAL